MTIKGIALKIILVALVALSMPSGSRICYADQQEAVRMSYTKDASKFITYKYEDEGTINMRVMGADVPSISRSSGVVQHKISNVTKGKIAHEFSFISFKTESSDDLSGDFVHSAGTKLRKPLIMETGIRGENPNLTNSRDLPTVDDFPYPPIIDMIALVQELPKLAVRPNDTWQVAERYMIDHPTGKIKILAVGKFTYVGKENRQGFICMKMKGNFGVMSRLSTVMAKTYMEMENDGELDVTGYFAYEEGFFVEINILADADLKVQNFVANEIITGTMTSSAKFTYIKEGN